MEIGRSPHLGYQAGDLLRWRDGGRLGPLRQGAEVVIEVVDGVGLEAKLRDALGRVARNDQCHLDPAL